jgi:hypothetical protein
MRVKPDQPNRLLTVAKVFRHTGQSSQGDGMVAPEHDGQARLFQSLLYKTRQLLAGLQDFLQKEEYLLTPDYLPRLPDHLVYQYKKTLAE